MATLLVPWCTIHNSSAHKHDNDVDALKITKRIKYHTIDTKVPVHQESIVGAPYLMCDRK